MSLQQTQISGETPNPPNDVTGLVWAARTGISTVFPIYDSSDLIVLGIKDEYGFPGDESLRKAHSRATKEWVDERDVRLPDVDAYLFLDPTFEQNWSKRIAEKYDVPLSLLEYSINFNDSRWEQYDVSISGTTEIPGLHGTLRKELKVQGFPTHRTDAQEEVRIWTTLSHVETDTLFYSDVCNTYSVPDAHSQNSYPFVRPVLMSIYRAAFSDVEDYHDLLSERFTLCERCGVYDTKDADTGVSVETVTDPDGGWRREYCTDCYANVLNDKYGVVTELAKLYIEYDRGAPITKIAEQYGESEKQTAQLLDRLDTAITTKEGF